MEQTSPEQWRPVVGYEGLYEVSDQGRMRSLRLGRTLTVPPNLSGYRQTTIRDADGRRDNAKLHILVATAFHGPRPDGHQCRHLNGDKLDNRAINLAWGTAAENQQDSVRHGTHTSTKRTHCPSGHAYTEANTRLDRGKRYCRICLNRQGRARYARKRALKG